MSDTPRNDDWWQASDLKWYPPQQPQRRRGWMLPTAILVVVALVAAGTVFLLLGRDDTADAATIALEPAATSGTDPFTDSIAITEVAEFPDTVTAVITTTIDELPTDPATATLTATGTTPGLYGGTRDDSACDTTALSDFLTDPDNTDKATAFATTAGTTTDELPDYLATLTPSVLTLDTRVTNHGYTNGRATPRQSVLQAGTAVLVDPLGTPAVRCSCGNPLTTPDPIDLATATTTGDTWTSYSPDTTTAVTPAPDPQQELTLLDTNTGDTFTRPTGASATWVVVGGTTSSDASGATPTGTVLTSQDGATWEQTHETPTPLSGVAYGDGRFVAVGTGGDRGIGGTVLSSADGRSWEQVATVDDELVDVAYGDGRWLAIGRTASWSSDDGRDWTPLQPFEFDVEQTFAQTVAHGDGRFLMYVSSCGATRCFPYEMWTSTDGTSWSVDPSSATDSPGLPGNGESPSLAYAGTFGIVGNSPGEVPDGAPMAAQRFDPTAGLLQDGTWVAVPQGPELYLNGLTGAGTSWVAVGGPREGRSGVHTSTDLASWTRIADLDTQLTDIAVSGPIGEPAETEAPPAEPAGSCNVDLNDPVLDSYEAAEEQVDAGFAPGRDAVARDVASLTAATGVEWCSEMVIAIAASQCNDWGQSSESTIPPAGRRAWAEQVAPALGISVEAANTAIDTGWEIYAPCG